MPPTALHLLGRSLFQWLNNSAISGSSAPEVVGEISDVWCFPWRLPVKAGYTYQGISAGVNCFRICAPMCSVIIR